MLAAKKPCSSFVFSLPAPSAQVMLFAPPDGVIDLEEATLARIRDTPDKTAEQYAFCRDPELWVDSEHFASIWRNIEVRCDGALQRLALILWSGSLRPVGCACIPWLSSCILRGNREIRSCLCLAPLVFLALFFGI